MLNFSYILVVDTKSIMASPILGLAIIFFAKYKYYIKKEQNHLTK